MKLTPHYLVYVNYPDLGLALGDPVNFSDACDRFAEYRDENYDAGVFRVEPGNGEDAGIFLDVTNDALANIRRRLNVRRQEWPEWLEAA